MKTFKLVSSQQQATSTLRPCNLKEAEVGTTRLLAQGPHVCMARAKRLDAVVRWAAARQQDKASFATAEPHTCSTRESRLRRPAQGALGRAWVR